MKWLTGLLLIALSIVGLAAAEPHRPNIVLILADDLGWTGLGCYGSTFYETPNIDRLASEGVKFSNAFSAAANCAPSRASILSGQYTPRHGVLYVGPGDYQDKWKARKGDLKRFKMIQPRGKTELAPTIETLGAALNRGGYRTAMFGKWHLGLGENHPSKRGFDVAIESHGAHFNFHTDPNVPYQAGTYLSDFLSDQAVKFIETSAKAEQPFFLYYPDFLVHKPFEAKENDLEHFRDKEPSETQRSPMAAAMIKALDDSVGKLMAAIDRLGIAENTLVVFTSDNGGLSYEEDGLREKNTSNHPLRGRKGSEYDGGLRVPWFVRRPGTIPAGKTCETPVHHIDLYPTFLKTAGVEFPKDQPLDGIDLSGVFEDPAAGAKARILFWYLPGYSAFHSPSVMARKDEWKLISSLEGDEYQLFQTAKDIGETQNRALKNSPIAEGLNQAAMDWLDETEAPRMMPNPGYDPAPR